MSKKHAGMNAVGMNAVAVMNAVVVMVYAVAMVKARTPTLA